MSDGSGRRFRIDPATGNKIYIPKPNGKPAAQPKPPAVVETKLPAITALVDPALPIGRRTELATTLVQQLCEQLFLGGSLLTWQVAGCKERAA